MFTPLIEFLKTVKPEDVGGIDLEEIALIQALRTSYPPDSKDAKELSYVPDLVNNWLKLDFDELTPAFNMRMQPLLRNVLNTLIEGGVKELSPYQTQYLLSVSDLLEKVKGTDKNNRLLQLLRNSKEKLLNKITGDEVSGLPDLLNTFRFTTAKEIEKSSRKNITTFGGIDLSLNGPMLKHTGDIKVLDYVPDDTMLQVEDGNCYVSGYVLGHVSATGQCEVKENIAGTVIADQGSVHARNILKKAYVVSKWNDVITENTQEPELVFAGKKLHVHGKVFLGNYVAPAIQVDGEISGGELSFSETCNAQRFSLPQSRNLILELQDRISCDVYGGLIDPEAGRLIASINKVKTRQEHVTKMVKVIHAECEHFATNGIMYLLGGDIVHSQLEEITRKQRRIAFLERIINGIDGLAQNAHIHLIQQQRRRAKRQLATYGTTSMEEINEDLLTVKDASDLDADLVQEGQELHNMTMSMARREPVSMIELNKLDSKKQKWVNEKYTVAKELAQLEMNVRKPLANNSLINSQDENTSKMKLLNQLIQSTKNRPNEDPVVQRARSSFVQFAIRTIEQRKHRMLNHRNLLIQLSDEYDQLCAKLKSKHNLDPPVEDDETPSPVATGIFDQDIIICTDKYLLENPDGENDSLLFTTASPVAQSYTIKDHKIQLVE